MSVVFHRLFSMRYDSSAPLQGAGIGVCLGPSPQHASSIHLILNIKIHCAYNDYFETPRLEGDVNSHWQCRRANARPRGRGKGGSRLRQTYDNVSKTSCYHMDGFFPFICIIDATILTRRHPFLLRGEFGLGKLFPFLVGARSHLHAWCDVTSHRPPGAQDM